MHAANTEPHDGSPSLKGKSMRITAGTTLTIALGCTVLLPAAQAQDYPDKPIRMIVPVLPGGAPDYGGRIVAERLSARLGQKVVVENRAGAGGIIALEVLKASPPNGYTIASTQMGPLTITPLIQEGLSYDPVRDFTHITNLLTFPTLLAAHVSLPAKNVKELIALARAHPGEVTYASSGAGGTGHISAELFNLMAKIKMQRIQFKSVAPSLISVLSGESQITYANISAALPHIHSGRLRVLGVTSAKRVPSLPDIATISESGLPGYECTGGAGIIGPPSMPKNIVQRLNKEIVEILNSKEVADLMLTVGMLPAPTTPEEFTAYIRAELKKWAPVVKQAIIKGE
jgi:tripartite-type tricarboxylate transporter receptor subunit TctC